MPDTLRRHDVGPDLSREAAASRPLGRNADPNATIPLPPPSGCPDLPDRGERTARPGIAPVLESVPTRLPPRHWTGDRIVSLIAVIVLGWLGWALAAVCWVDRDSGGDTSERIVGVFGYVSLAVLVVWTIAATTIYAGSRSYWRRAPRRVWWIVWMGWLIAIPLAVGRDHAVELATVSTVVVVVVAAVAAGAAIGRQLGRRSP